MSTIPLNLITDNVVLPEPRVPGQASLLQALQHRRSVRAFQPQTLDVEQLSSLLWAAAGINRPDTGGRTAPSAHNWQEIAIYALLAEGSYLYGSWRRTYTCTVLRPASAPSCERWSTGACWPTRWA
jgi:hypothetical protein